jgi:hypothetical protein
MKRRTRTVLLSAAVPVLAAAAIAGGGWLIARRGYRQPPKLPESATLVPGTVSRPGDAARAELEFTLPWGVSVTEAAAETGNDAAVSGPVEIDSKWRWGHKLWRVGATIRPLGTGGSVPGKLRLVLDRPLPGVEDRAIAVAVPAVKVADDGAPTVDKPRLADPEAPGKRSAKWPFYALGGALLALAATFAWIFFRPRRKAAAPTPWEQARAELAALRAAMEKSSFRPGTGVAQLSDILRRYLAARFELPAATEPGCRFLDAPAAAEHLTEGEREFLRGFFTAAEPVMFARFPADRAELERAVAAAGELVERTVPAPPERKRGENPREAES